MFDFSKFENRPFEQEVNFDRLSIGSLLRQISSPSHFSNQPRVTLRPESEKGLPIQNSSLRFFH
jgi:hypothetical protein